MRATDENDRAFFRTDRVFNVNANWFFATREGQNHGPFSTRSAAEQALRAFIRDKQREQIDATAGHKPLQDYTALELEVIDEPTHQRTPGRQALGRHH